MRRSLLVCFVLCLAYALQAQKPMSIKIKDPIVCYATAEDHAHYLPPPREYLNLKAVRQTQAATNMEVTYIGFENVPQAQQAFQRAVDIWSSLLNSSVTIRIEARWVSLASNVLGSANYTAAYANFEGAQKLNVFYPVALAEKITGRELNAGQPDIFANFNMNFDWHFDPDDPNVPAEKYDLTTVVLHEIGHGLGFSGSFAYSNTVGQYGLAGSGVPVIYDVFLENALNQNLIETKSSPSVPLGAELTSNNLFFNGFSDLSRIYAPTTFNGGSSISHLNEVTYNGTADALMTPQIASREQLHSPGRALRILGDLGWETLKIQHNKLADTENATGPYSVTAKIVADSGYNASTVKLHYTNDGVNFTSVLMTPSGPEHTFTGAIPFSGLGNYGYFISAENERGIEYTNPGKRVRPKNTQQQLLHIFKVGPDLSPPKIIHTKKPFLLDSETEFVITAEISDNSGSVDAVLSYTINDIPQPDKAFTLIAPESDSIHTVSLDITSLTHGDRIKYRIIATDHAANMNTAYSPSATDYHVINVVGLEQTRYFYSNDFESTENDDDFFGTGYTISTPAGFSNRAIHSEHPYTNGDGLPGNQRNLIYQLRIPIRLKASDATLKFDEIVLVEPGAVGSSFGSSNFYDYVIVEGSKDGGETWLPLLPGYDATSRPEWLTRYNSAINSSTGNSTASGDPTLYRPRIIDLLNTFNAGDEIVIRFRLYIDQLANAWGWAIDNLKIQIDETPPLILHDHIDYITSSTNLPDLNVIVSDANNFGDVVMSFRVNTNEITGTLTATGVGSGDLIPFDFPVEEFSAGDVLEYSITVTDEYSNTATLPKEGFFTIPFFTPQTPVSEYHTDFNNAPDFVGNFFSVSKPSGFENNLLRVTPSSTNKYPLGFGLDSTSNFSYTLKSPVIISENNALMRFDEIVLVEGHNSGAVFGTPAFNDYVIVEGSKDNGQTWLPFLNGYDAAEQTIWRTAFTNNLAGTPAMFYTRIINMKESGDFNTGDQVLIRFRLYSDKKSSGWGWAIDNLYIQNPVTGLERMPELSLSIFPNPVRDNLTINMDAGTSTGFIIELLSIHGQTVYHATENPQDGKLSHVIPAQQFSDGLYLVKISSGSTSVVRKILKKR